jgi:hypothetical protein
LRVASFLLPKSPLFIPPEINTRSTKKKTQQLRNGISVPQASCCHSDASTSFPDTPSQIQIEGGSGFSRTKTDHTGSRATNHASPWFFLRCQVPLPGTTTRPKESDGSLSGISFIFYLIINLIKLHFFCVPFPFSIITSTSYYYYSTTTSGAAKQTPPSKG